MLKLFERARNKSVFVGHFIATLARLSIRRTRRGPCVRVRVSKIENTQLLTTVIQYVLASGRNVALVPTFKTLANSRVYGPLWYHDSRVALDVWPLRLTRADFTISDTTLADVLLRPGGYDAWNKSGAFPLNAFPLGVNPRCAFGDELHKRRDLREQPRQLTLFFRQHRSINLQLSTDGDSLWNYATDGSC